MATQPNPILNIDNQDYLLYSTKVSIKSQLNLRFQKFRQQFIALTSVSWDKSTFAKDDLENVCRRYEEEDDVWCRSFLSLVILLQPSKMNCAPTNKRIFAINNSRARLPSGPLVVERSTGQIFLVAKLQRDTQYAFSMAILPSLKTKGTFKEFKSPEKLQVPLPSRLYFPRDSRKPLNGVRIAVKDNIALKGLRTSFGSSAWLDTWPAESTTAPCIQQLIDAGAIIVGKAKTTEFTEGIDAHEWIHEICPFNPRGDGQQEVSSSSAGGAAAMAAYTWLDVSIGTDTGGSIRHPAAVNGIYGQRPTHGRIDVAGVLGTADLFDTVGIFARDVETFVKVGNFMVDPSAPARLPPTQRKFHLLYPTRAAQTQNPDPHHGGQHRWFPHPEVDPSIWTEAEKQFEQTVVSIEKLLDCTRIPFNINELWSATHVIGQPRSLDEAVGPIYSAITTSAAVHNKIDKFVEEYKSQNGGATPPMADIVQARFEYGRSVKPETIASALEAAEAFKEWTKNTLFGSYDQDSTTLLIFPQTCGRSNYRDEIAGRGPLFNDTFSIYAFGYLVGCPDYTLPVAEIPYQSKVTNRVEYLPAALSLVGRPGTDGELFDIVEYLHRNGVVLDVAAGSRMFPRD